MVQETIPGLVMERYLVGAQVHYGAGKPYPAWPTRLEMVQRLLDVFGQAWWRANEAEIRALWDREERMILASRPGCAARAGVTL